IYLWRGEKQRARSEVALLRQEAPNEAVVYFVKATLHRLDSEYERALRSYDRLVQLDPAAHIVAHYNRALIYIYLGRHTDAHHVLDQARASEPDNPMVQTYSALTSYYEGDVAAAAQLMQKVLETHPGMHGVRPFFAIFLSALGRHEEARAQLTDQVKQNAVVDPDIAYHLASAYAMEGMTGEAFEWLERAIALGNANRAWFEHDPNWASLRSEPRFTELMQTIEMLHPR
ncbi:MAG: tetratricopeptide repeat protein, partial [Pyrinomonadaceae bacterium]